MFLCVLVHLLIVLPLMSYAGTPTNTIGGTTSEDVNKYVQDIYRKIAFPKGDTLNFEIFRKAMQGYINLRNADKLNTSKRIISICDLTRSANDFRLWIIDLDSKNILFHTYVAHGQGSGEEFAKAFSNRNNSHQTSLGFYVTGETYEGEHGTSLKLNGMDNGYNSAALDRGIVVHGADYVCNQFISENQRLGRSWGCPAVPANLSLQIINTIKDGTCLFIYYPQKKYLQTAYWLNKKIDRLPEDNRFELIQNSLPKEMTMPQAAPTAAVSAPAVPALQPSAPPVRQVDPGAILLN